MAKIFLPALLMYMIAFQLWRVLQENNVAAQLLHAIKSFCGADWNFAVG